MANRALKGIQFEASSGNVFRDLALPDAEQLKIKSGLVIEITRAVRRLGMTQEEAARRMGISQAESFWPDARRFLQPLGTKVDGVSEPPRVQH